MRMNQSINAYLNICITNENNDKYIPISNNRIEITGYCVFRMMLCTLVQQSKRVIEMYKIYN